MKEAKYKGKKHLLVLANNANKKMVINKFLQKKLEIYNNYNNFTKEMITKNISDKEDSILLLFNNYKNKIQQDLDNNKKEYENIFLKFNKLLDECRSDITMGKPSLTQKKNEEFILDYLKIEKDNIINLLKRNIKSSKEYHLFREPKRDNLIGIKKGNKETERQTNELQQKVLYEFKKCNKFNNQIKKNNIKIHRLRKNIELLKKYIEINKNSVNKIMNSKVDNKPKEGIGKLGKSERIPKNLNFGRKIFKGDEENRNNSDDDRETNNRHKHKNKIIMEFIKVENLFNISSEEGENEKIIDDELHSDDEGIFENKLKNQKQLSTNYLKQIKESIPQFDFNQINFNKTKQNGEVDIYSIQRRKYKSKNIDSQIKDMKNKIEKINQKIELLNQKESIMKEFIKKLKEKYEDLKPMIYQTTVNNIITNDFILKSLTNGFRTGEKYYGEKEDIVLEKNNEEEEKDDTLDDIFGPEVNEEIIPSDDDNENKNDNIEKSADVKKEIEKNKEKKEKKIKDFEEEEEEKMERKLLNTVWKKNVSLKKNINLNIKNKRVSLPVSILKSNIKKNLNSNSRAKSK